VVTIDGADIGIQINLDLAEIQAPALERKRIQDREAFDARMRAWVRDQHLGGATHATEADYQEYNELGGIIAMYHKPVRGEARVTPCRFDGPYRHLHNIEFAEGHVYLSLVFENMTLERRAVFQDAEYKAIFTHRVSVGATPNKVRVYGVPLTEQEIDPGYSEALRAVRLIKEDRTAFNKTAFFLFLFSFFSFFSQMTMEAFSNKKAEK
jgi:hypothetical protein